MRAQFLFAGAKHKNTSVGEQVEGNLMLPGDWEVNDRRSRQLDELCSIDGALGSNTNRFLSFAAEISATWFEVGPRPSFDRDPVSTKCLRPVYTSLGSAESFSAPGVFEVFQDCARMAITASRTTARI